MADTDKIRARLTAATGGCWMRGGNIDYFDEDGNAEFFEAVVTGGSAMKGVEVACATTSEDAEFVAHAPDDIRDLLAEVEQLRARVAEVERVRATTAHTLQPNVLEEIEARLTATTGDNWRRDVRVDSAGNETVTDEIVANNGARPYTIANMYIGVNAEFVAHARDDMRVLIEEVNRIDRDRERLLSELAWCNIDRLNDTAAWNVNRHARDFMAAMKQDVATLPRVPTDDVVRLRLRLVAEEFCELLDAAVADPNGASTIRTEVMGFIAERELRVDLPTLIDACADIDYVVAGMRAAFGVDGGPVALLVHTANMAKLTGPVREDGKRMKPAGWTPPDIEGELRRQGWGGA